MSLSISFSLCIWRWDLNKLSFKIGWIIWSSHPFSCPLIFQIRKLSLRDIQWLCWIMMAVFQIHSFFILPFPQVFLPSILPLQHAFICLRTSCPKHMKCTFFLYLFYAALYVFSSNPPKNQKCKNHSETSLEPINPNYPINNVMSLSFLVSMPLFLNMLCNLW